MSSSVLLRWPLSSTHNRRATVSARWVSRAGCRPQPGGGSEAGSEPGTPRRREKAGTHTAQARLLLLGRRLRGPEGRSRASQFAEQMAWPWPGRIWKERLCPEGLGDDHLIGGDPGDGEGRSGRKLLASVSRHSCLGSTHLLVLGTPSGDPTARAQPPTAHHRDSDWPGPRPLWESSRGRGRLTWLRTPPAPRHKQQQQQQQQQSDKSSSEGESGAPGGAGEGDGEESRLHVSAVAGIRARKGCFIENHPSAFWDKLGHVSRAECAGLGQVKVATLPSASARVGEREGLLFDQRPRSGPGWGHAGASLFPVLGATWIVPWS